MSEVSMIARVAPVATGAELADPAAVQHHEMFQQGALGPAPWREIADIPVFVDHVKDAEPIGHVTAIRSEDCWRVGTWIMVHARVTDPPSWLREGTPVSIGHSAYAMRTPWRGEWDHVQGSFLNELSLLSPGKQPGHPHAAVTWVGRPAVRTENAVDREVDPWLRAAQLAAAKRGILIRPGIGRVERVV